MGGQVLDEPLRLAIGPPKTATTWLYDALLDHPGLRLATSKEVRFFTDHFDRGIDWYLRQFRPGSGPLVDVCHDYILDPAVPGRIAGTCADVRFLVTLRDPVDRAFSDYRNRRRQGRTSGSFGAALDDDPDLVRFGDYRALLEPFVAAFGPGAFALCTLDDLARDPAGFQAAALAGLGVGPHPLSPDRSAAANPARDSRAPAMTAVLRGAGRVLQSGGLHRVVHRVKRNHHVERLLYRDAADELPDPVEVERIRETTAASVLWLDDLFGSSLAVLWGYDA